MTKYLKVIDGLKSNANGFNYKIGEINEAEVWNPNESNPKKMGGFNFSTETKILRWLIRGDTLYDVEIPIGATIIDCPSKSAPHGVFRANKIIIKNPRPITDEIAMKLYKKSELPEKSYYKAMAGCAVRGYMKTANKILEDKINQDNVLIAISEYEDFCTPSDSESFNPKKHLNQNTKEIYEKLKNYIK